MELETFIGLIVFFAGGWLVLREEDSDHLGLVVGMFNSAMIAFLLWMVIMVGLGSLL